ncbi:CGGC domain-containing protein [Gemmatimonadota bacterium]
MVDITCIYDLPYCLVKRAPRFKPDLVEDIMANIAVLYCKKVKDCSCIACAKCYKAMAEKNGEYGRHDTIELVAMTDCGDCPGLTVPKLKLLKEVTTGLERPIDVIHFGTCVKLAMETAACPIDFDDMKAVLENKFGVEVVLGTHTY